MSTAPTYHCNKDRIRNFHVPELSRIQNVCAESLCQNFGDERISCQPNILGYPSVWCNWVVTSMALDAQQHEKILGRKIGAWESNTDIQSPFIKILRWNSFCHFFSSGRIWATYSKVLNTYNVQPWINTNGRLFCYHVLNYSAKSRQDNGFASLTSRAHRGGPEMCRWKHFLSLLC
jgi:hypothetical protein